MIPVSRGSRSRRKSGQLVRDACESSSARLHRRMLPPLGSGTPTSSLLISISDFSGSWSRSSSRWWISRLAFLSLSETFAGPICTDSRTRSSTTLAHSSAARFSTCLPWSTKLDTPESGSGVAEPPTVLLGRVRIAACPRHDSGEAPGSAHPVAAPPARQPGSDHQPW